MPDYLGKARKSLGDPLIKSINWRLGEECFNRHVFTNGRAAREIAGNWRGEYNRYWPHSYPVYQTPEQFAPAFQKPLELPNPGRGTAPISLLWPVRNMGVGHGRFWGLRYNPPA